MSGLSPNTKVDFQIKCWRKLDPFTKIPVELHGGGAEFTIDLHSSQNFFSFDDRVFDANELEISCIWQRKHIFCFKTTDYKACVHELSFRPEDWVHFREELKHLFSHCGAKLRNDTQSNSHFRFWYGFQLENGEKKGKVETQTSWSRR
jgi:hypothetical protein